MKYEVRTVRKLFRKAFIAVKVNGVVIFRAETFQCLFGIMVVVRMRDQNGIDFFQKVAFSRSVDIIKAASDVN